MSFFRHERAFPLPVREWHKSCLGRVVDILGASGASDPGSNPGRDVDFSTINESNVSCDFEEVQLDNDWIHLFLDCVVF